MNDQAVLEENATVPRHQGREIFDEHQELIMLVRDDAVTGGSAEIGWLRAGSASNSKRSPSEFSDTVGVCWGIEDGAVPDVEILVFPQVPFFESDAYTDWMQVAGQRLRCVLDNDSKTARPAGDRIIPSCSRQERSLTGFIDAHRLASSSPVHDAVFPNNQSGLHATAFVGTARWMNDLDRLLDRLFVSAHEEQFEAGMESRFSKELQHLCDYRPTELLRALRSRLAEGSTPPEVLAEVLAWASREERNSSCSDIVDLLTLGLYSRWALVRDAAALGLAYFHGEASILPLRSAVEREELPELRADMEALVNSLET